MELNHNFDRLCRSTTEPSVNLTLKIKKFFFINFASPPGVGRIFLVFAFIGTDKKPSAIL